MIGNGIGIPFQRKSGGDAPFVGLLDEVPGAAFATSVRLLRNDYSGGLMRVIAYDGATQHGAADVMPYKIGDNYWVDLNSTLENLDATAIGRGLTTSDTLADLCSVEVNNYDGLVPTWYGQNAGAPISATQTSISSMGKIVVSGVLETENGKPALRSDGENVTYNAFSNELADVPDITAFLTHKTISTGGIPGIFQVTGDGTLQYFGVTNEYAIRYRLGNTTYTPINSLNHNIITAKWNTGSSATHGIFINATAATQDGSATLDTTNGGIELFQDTPTANVRGHEKLQELIIYPSDKLNKRVIIETNANNAYNAF